jgi:hypothetical protein
MMWFGWFVTMLGVVCLVSACAKLVSIHGIWSNPAQVKERLRQSLVALAIGIGLLAIGLGLLAEHLAYRAPNS